MYHPNLAHLYPTGMTFEEYVKKHYNVTLGYFYEFDREKQDKIREEYKEYKEEYDRRVRR